PPEVRVAVLPVERELVPRPVGVAEPLQRARRPRGERRGGRRDGVAGGGRGRGDHVPAPGQEEDGGQPGETMPAVHDDLSMVGRNFGRGAVRGGPDENARTRRSATILGG